MFYRADSGPVYGAGAGDSDVGSPAVSHGQATEGTCISRVPESERCPLFKYLSRRKCPVRYHTPVGTQALDRVGGRGAKRGGE